MSQQTVTQSPLNFAREDKFVLTFQPPPALLPIQKHHERSECAITTDAIQFSIFGTIVPEYTVPAKEVRYAGSNIYLSSHSKKPYSGVKVNFLVDNNYNNYWYLFKWINLLHNQREGIYDVENLTKGYSPTDNAPYMTDMTVLAKDEYNNDVIKFTYKKAFPTELGQLVYDYKNSKEITCNFTFVFAQLHVDLI